MVSPTVTVRMSPVSKPVAVTSSIERSVVMLPYLLTAVTVPVRVPSSLGTSPPRVSRKKVAVASAVSRMVWKSLSVKTL